MPTSKDLKNLDLQVKKTFISSQSFKRQSSFDVSKSIVGIHKNISSLAGSVRRTVIRVGALEKAVQNNSRKITSLKNISALQGPQIRGTNIGAKIPGNQSESLNKNISIITDAVSSIAETLKQQYKVDQKTTEYNRKNQEQEKRGLAESKLEKGFDGIKRLAEKVIAPVKSFLDRILEFFTTVILGRIVYKLVEWLGDPKNTSKVKSIIRFVKDWWPALLASYVLFGNSFSGLIRGTIGMVTRFTIQLARVAIPSLLRFVSGNPLIAAGAVAGAATFGAEMWRQGEEKKQVGKEASKRNVKPEVVKSELEKSKASPFALFGQGMTAAFSGGGLAKFNGGGLNDGSSSSGYVSGEKGVDKVPALLSDGEFVMSVGAVEKYGVDTFEAMNAAGGGTNKPKIMGGKIYAAGGGYIGETNEPFAKNPLGAISRFFKYKFGVDIANKSTWGDPSIPQKTSQSKVSTRSLLTDPLGAISRITSNMGIKTNVPTSTGSSRPPSGSGNLVTKIADTIRSKTLGSKKQDTSKGKGFFKEIQENLMGSGSATYRDAGSLYAKQMFGGFGGPISERDLSKESQAELQKAIQRAKKRTGSEIAKAEAKIKELRTQGAKDGNPALETQKSFLKKLKAGGIRVQYADYVDERGKLSESAKNAKNILGQFWATQRSKKEGGGYRVEDKYDFDMLKKKDERTGKMRDMNTGELLMEGVLGKGKTIQQRLQAAYLLNPLKGKGDVDMVLGGTRTKKDSMNLTAQKALASGGLGAALLSGAFRGNAPKTKNEKALEAKRPWWDKMGWFGGATASVQRKKQEEARRASQSGQYGRYSAGPSQRRIKPVSPPVSKKPKVVYGPPAPTGKSARSNKPAASKAPRFSATTKGAKTKADLIGVHR